MKLAIIALVVSTAALAAPSRPVPPAQTWAEFMGITEFAGELRIERLRPASFAHVIRLRRNDVVVALNGVAVNTPEKFQRTALWFAEHRPQRWQFRVVRPGFTKPITITPAPQFPCDPLKLEGCGHLPQPGEND